MAEVIIVQPPPTTDEPHTDEAFPPGVPEIAGNLASFAHSQNVDALPPDFAMNHDHYLHGAPKGIDQA